jgi:prolipoprotein diacylglyceryltransferase
LFRRVPLDKYRAGSIALLTIFGYSIIRFAMEYLRADGNIVLGTLTATQLQCIVLLVLSAGLGMISKHATDHQNIRSE